MPISAHRVAVLMALSLGGLAVLAPLAAAQTDRTLVLEPQAASADVLLGEDAAFAIVVRNVALVDTEAGFELTSTLPVGWTYSFTPARVTVPGGAARNVTLALFPPDDARAGDVANVTFRAREPTTQVILSQAASVEARLVAPPPAEGGEPTPTPTPDAPRFRFSATDAEGRPGDTVQASVTLTNDDTRAFEVQLSPAARAGWGPRFLTVDSARQVYPGAPVTVRVYADIPASAPQALETFTLLARIGETTFTTTWNLTILAPAGDATPTPAPPTAPAPSPTPASPTPAPTRAATAGLSLTLERGELDVPAGGDASSLVYLVNTGGVALSVSLVGLGPEGWSAPTFDPASFDLAPGDARTARMTLAAPADAPAGGFAQGSVSATGEGLLKTVPFTLRVVPGEPALAPGASSAPAAAITAELPESSNGLLLGVAAAVGTIGAGALLLANRPFREKLLWGAVGLYTRLARPDVLGHDERQKLYSLIERSPGVHFHALQRELAWNTGTLTYHLRVLERHGFVVSRRDGLYRRFYLQGAAPRKELFETQGPTGLRADVLEGVRSHHGISQSDLALALGQNKQTVNYHVKALERAGLIRIEKRGRDTYLYPASSASAHGPEPAST